MPKAPPKPKRIPKTKKARCRRFNVSPEMYDTLMLLPNYDPFRDANGEGGPFLFDESHALQAIGFFEDCLTHTKGEMRGKPFDVLDWQRAIIANLWGWRDAKGYRRYRQCLIYVAKKNGKTELAAGLGLAILCLDHEPGAEVYSAGAAKDQAAYAWKAAVVMVKKESELNSRLKVYGEKGGSVMKSIVYPAEGSVYKVISADCDTQDGFNPHGALVDEVHRQKTPEFVDLIETSTGTRRQPLTVFLTTADYDRVSPCNTLHNFAVKVCLGVFPDPRFLPVLFEANRDDDWQSPAVWRKANPSMGRVFPESFIAGRCQKAKQQPSYLNTFKRLHLNIITERKTTWLDMLEWDACAGEIAALALRDYLKGRDCWGGLDLSTTRDTTALSLIFPFTAEEEHARVQAGGKVETDGKIRSYWLLPFVWIPTDNAVEREKADNVPYLTWATGGFLDMTEGNVVDYRAIRQRLNLLDKEYRIQEVGYDPYNATQLALELQDEDGFKMILMRQGWKTMSEPTKHFGDLVHAGRLRHGGHPVLRWMAANAAVKIDDKENTTLTKDKEGKKRIDGMVAAAMALGLAMVRTQAGGSPIFFLEN